MQKSLITLMLALLATLPTAAFAEQALVPQSGQTLCYDATGTEILCAGSGQDGDQQLGILWPTPRFTVNGNGTITDNLTGLIWLKNLSCFGNVNDWAGALSTVNNLANGACGLTDGSVAADWRLPNRAELMSLVNRGQSSPSTWLNNMGFTSVTANPYWSSSTSNGSPWAVFFSNGTISKVPTENYAGWLLPVRGGQ